MVVLAMSLRFVLMIFASLFATSIHAETLIFARNEKLPEQDIAESIFRTAAAKLNLAVKIQALPPARAAAANDSGEVAGEIARIASYSLKHPNLVRVSPAHYSLTSVLYAKKVRNLEIKSPLSLYPYRVGIIRGVQHSLDATQGVKTVEVVKDSLALFRMLDADRLDVVSTTGIDGEIMLRHLGFQNSITQVHEVAKFPLYIYLNPKYAYLQAPLSKALHDMEQSGEMKKIIEREELKLINGT